MTSRLHSALLGGPSSCNKLVCCEIKPVLSSCSIHVPYPHLHRARQHMDPRFFPHASECDNTRTCTHACVLMHTNTCRSDCCPLSDPCKQQSSPTQLFSLSCGDLCSFRDSHTVGPGIVCALADLTHLRRSSSLRNPLVNLVVWWVKIFW